MTVRRARLCSTPARLPEAPISREGTGRRRAQRRCSRARWCCRCSSTLGRRPNRSKSLRLEVLVGLHVCERRAPVAVGGLHRPGLDPLPLVIVPALQVDRLARVDRAGGVLQADTNVWGAGARRIGRGCDSGGDQLGHQRRDGEAAEGLQCGCGVQGLVSFASGLADSTNPRRRARIPPSRSRHSNCRPSDTSMRRLVLRPS